MKRRRFDTRYYCRFLTFLALTLAGCSPAHPEGLPSTPPIPPFATRSTSIPRRVLRLPDASSDAPPLDWSIGEFARLRHLNPPFRPALLIVPRARIAPLLDEELVARNSRAQSRPLEFIYRSWGLLPEGIRSETQVLEYFYDAVEGVYLSSVTAIVLPKEAGPNFREDLLLHETVHAYQDARFRLGTRLTYEPGRGDALAALHALAEGEALFVERRSRSYWDGTPLPTVEETSSQLLESLSGMPLAAVERLSLIAPYVDGYHFVRELVETGGFPMLDRVWALGLPSTQGLLHPERWLAASNTGDPSALVPKVHVVPAPPQPNPLSRPIFEEQLGEQGLRILLQLTERESDARRLASTYWDDRLVLFESPESRDVFWHLRLDHAEATEATAPILEDLLAPATNRPRTGEWGQRDRARTKGRLVPATNRTRTGDCVPSDRALLAMSVSGRDIYVSTRVHTDTWTAAKRQNACDDLVRWLSRAERASIASR